MKKYFACCMTLLFIMILAAGCTPSTDMSPIPAEEGSFSLEIELSGSKYEAPVDSWGRLKNSVQFTSADGTVSLAIDKGTILPGKDNKPLQYINIVAIDSFPLPPENTQIMGDIYELSPEGVAASALMRLTLNYNPGDLPDGVSEDKVYIMAYTDEEGWEPSYYKNVDIENHRVTTQINGSGRFAVLAPLTSLSSRNNTIPTTQPGRVISLDEALSNGKPTLAEFGSSTCIPCKQMKPILEELAVEYEGKMNVVIIEVYEQMELARYFRIVAVPTQIVFDSEGKMVNQHVGLWPKEEIVSQLEKMDIE